MKLFKHLIPAGLLLTAVLITVACETTYSRPQLSNAKRFVVFRSPYQMVPFSSKDTVSPAESNSLDSASVPKAKPQRRPLPTVTDLEDRVEPKNAAEAVDALIAAHQSDASGDDFSLNAVQTYEYERGAVYPVVTSPGFLTVLELEPGESVMNLAGGDTANWLIDTIDGGHDSQVRTNVLIKPRRPFQKTNLIITTDRRTYHLTVSSLDATAYHTAVNWEYLADKVVVRRKSTAEVADAVLHTATPEKQPNVNYGYFVLTQEHKRPPVWTPLRVYDDGRQVIIELPAESRHFARPVLFTRSPNGQLHLINYRTEGDRCITHSLFQEAELRLGGNVVRISRANYKFLSPRP